MSQMTNSRVAVVGSGLSAVGAIKALLKLGTRPTVLDWGETLDPIRTSLIDELAKKSPDYWTAEDRAILDHNPTIDKASIPKKLAFGSDYFYGKSRREAPVNADGNLPPFSYALGGLSVGWGAAVLPAQACDLKDWPINVDTLNRYCSIVLSDLPYSACDDGLSLNFPLLQESPGALHLSKAGNKLLQAFREKLTLKKDELVYGQARLMVRPLSSSDQTGCRYCGHCMSGCVYKSIYKAGDEITALHEEGQVDYLPGCLVDSVSEKDGKVTIRYFDADQNSHSKEFDRVFLAAGAVNSTRIALKSLGLFNKHTRLRSRGGFVVPIFSFRRLPMDWPNCNTQPALFLEVRGKGLEHWMHVQISAENEILLKKLKLHESSTGIVAKTRRFVADHLVPTLVNYHSDHSGTYDLWIESASDPGKSTCLHSRHIKSFPQFKVLWSSAVVLLKQFARIGCIPLFPFAKLNSGAYHVGGTLPMKAQPSDILDTDVLGRMSSWKRVHFVDSSIFPSLPGTTIGLLAMANAYRIVDQVQWSDQTGAVQ
jgi:hypothetical protein